MSATSSTTGSQDAVTMQGWIQGRRGAVALAALSAALLAVGALVLGVRSAPDDHGHATVGASLPGGYLRVDSVTADTPMKMAGMPMGKGPNMKDVPKGSRRFTVAVTLFAREGDGVRVSANRFRVSADGAPSTPPIDDDTDAVFVPRGASFPRQLTFDVPTRSRRVTLAVSGGDHAIPLALGPAPAGGHGDH